MQEAMATVRMTVASKGEEDIYKRAVKTLAGILRSGNHPLATLRLAVKDGSFPRELYDETLTVLREFSEVQALDLNNQREVLELMLELEIISQNLFRLFVSALNFVEPVTRGEAAQERTTESITESILVDAVRLLGEFPGDSIPEEKIENLRQAIAGLSKEEREGLRGFLGSAVLSEAERPKQSRKINVAATIEVSRILLGKRQAELTQACFDAYEILSTASSFKLRSPTRKPLMNVRVIQILHDFLQSWLDENPKDRHAEKASRALGVLESFLLKAADDLTRGVVYIDAVARQIVSTLPENLDQATSLIEEEVLSKKARLVSELQAASRLPLCQAEAAWDQVIFLAASLGETFEELGDFLLRDEKDYGPLRELPSSDRTKKILIFLEAQRKIVAEEEEVVREYLAASTGANKNSAQRRAEALAKTVQYLDEQISVHGGGR